MNTQSADHGEARAMGTGGCSDQYLSFVLAGEEYGIRILRVQEIRSWEGITEIPNTAEHVLGVINLRGAIVPVMDLRRRFGLDPLDYGKTTVLIVVNAEGKGKARTVGFVVDGVSDVQHLSAEERKAAPDWVGAGNTRFVEGLATVGGRLLILIDVDRLVDEEPIDLAQTARGTVPAERGQAATGLGAERRVDHS